GSTLGKLEATNLHAVSQLIVRAAHMRVESRGCHRRLDAMESSPQWVGRIEQWLSSGWHAVFVPDEAAA
ncbi:MAG: hypothetical protein ABI586_01695, partial [Candidatus Nanopelagicales bacterium]